MGESTGRAVVLVPVRRLQPASMLLAVFCFALPFLVVSCPGMRRSVSGIELAFGTTIEEPQVFGGAAKTRVSPEPLATAALICAVVGLCLSLTRVGFRSKLVGWVGATGAGLLVLLLAKANQQAAKQGQGILQISAGAGFWLAMLGFLASAASLVLVQRPDGEATSSSVEERRTDSMEKGSSDG